MRAAWLVTSGFWKCSRRPMPRGTRRRAGGGSTGPRQGHGVAGTVHARRCRGLLSRDEDCRVLSSSLQDLRPSRAHRGGDPRPRSSTISASNRPPIARNDASQRLARRWRPGRNQRRLACQSAGLLKSVPRKATAISGVSAGALSR